MNSSYLVLTYAVYAATAIPLVVWLSRTLTANGGTFLADVFSEQPGLAEAVNKLLAIGFLLVNLGYSLMLLTYNDGAGSLLEAVELLVAKLGTLLLSLGVMHFVNMYVFAKVRNRAEDRQQLPVAPTYVPAPAMFGNTPPPPPAPAPAGY